MHHRSLAPSSRPVAATFGVAALLLHGVVAWWLSHPMRTGPRVVDLSRRPGVVMVLLDPVQPTRTEPVAARHAPPRTPRRAPPAHRTNSKAGPAHSVATASMTSSAPSASSRSSDTTPEVSDANDSDSAALDVPAVAATLARPDHGQCPPPAYPPLLRDQGIEGVVKLRVRVDTSGQPVEVRLLEPSGWRLLDDAAVRHVRACRFVPARRGDEFIASWVEIPVRFTLGG